MDLYLPAAARHALARLAAQELRAPNAQATVLVVERLRELGLLAEPKARRRDPGGIEDAE